jgi:HEAT repeat protein
MSQNIQFKTVVDALLDEGQPFPARFLHRFSDLPPAELKILFKAWPKVSAQRKHALLEDLEYLAESDTLTCFDDLARLLLTDPDATVRVHAIRLLFESNDKRLVPIYLDILNNDEDIEARAAAANILGLFIYLGELEEIPTDLQHKIEDQLLKAVTTEKETLVRRRALESLGYSGRKEVIPLIEAAYRDKNPDWVVSALFAMGRSADDSWKKQVLSSLLAPDEDIRSEAIRAAGELELVAARTILLDLLEDEEDLELRRDIIWALSKIGGEGVRDRLEELLDLEMDDEEAEFIEDALDNVSMPENMAGLDLLDIEPDDDLHEVKPD